MKILLLQLARLGDIVQTWPTIKGLKRTYPGCEIHVLTRKKFSGPAQLHPFVDRVWELDTENLLSPVIHSPNGFIDSIRLLNDFTSSLSDQNFNFVINLTFSSFSSFLTSKIKSQYKRGYSRYSDGTPCFSDEISQYFYSHVGVGQANRIHVCDLFAKVSGVELTKEDWDLKSDQFKEIKKQKSVVIHVGASDTKKTYPPHKWSEVCQRLVDTNCKVSLVGSSSEVSIAEKIVASDGTKKIINLVGKTDLSELFKIISSAELFIGCDSGPLQIASVVGTRSLNLSFGTVNFWETGPKSSGSQILFEELPDNLDSSNVFHAALDMFEGIRTGGAVYVPGPTENYECDFILNSYDWDLIQFIYKRGLSPILNKDTKAQLLEAIQIVNKICRQLDKYFMHQPDDKEIQKLQILEFEIQNKLFQSLKPLGNWLESQKINIPPGNLNSIISRTRIVYTKLLKILSGLEAAGFKSKESFRGSNKMEPESNSRSV